MPTPTPPNPEAARPTTGWGRPSPRGWAVLACRTVGAVALSLVVWEVILRVTLSSPIPFHHDPVLGWMPKPHSAGLCGWEGRAVCRYNEWGFRDDPIGPPVAGQARIVCLGDSFTEGAQMPAAQTFPQVLQRRLRADRHAVRVFNGGRGGTGIPQLLGLAGAYRSIFQPDWVVLLLRDNWAAAFDPMYEFYYTDAGDGDGDGFQIVRAWHWEHMSAPKRFLIGCRLGDSALVQYGVRHLAEFPRAGAGADSAPSTPPAPPRADDPAVRLQFRALEWTLLHLKQDYPHLVIVHLPYSFAPTGGLFPVSPTEERLSAACRRLQIPCIPLRPVIEADFARTRRPPFGFANTLPWQGHPNAHGHALIARELAAFFRQTLTHGAPVPVDPAPTRATPGSSK